MIRHYLQPLLAPRSVALVGASEREGALGNIVYRNLASDSSLELFAVNPKHRSVHGKPAYARLTKLPKAPDLAVIAVPARAVPQVIEDAGTAGIRAAVVLTSGFGEADERGKKLQEEMLAAARRRRAVSRDQDMPKRHGAIQPRARDAALIEVKGRRLRRALMDT